MVEKAYLLLGLLAALLYAFAASSVKAAADRGMRSMQTTLLANIATALAFLVFIPWNNPPITPPEWWRALVIGAWFFLGQLFSVLALRRGHASIATPTMGSKVVFVALVLSIHKTVQINVWAAAALATIGIVILAWPTEHLPWKRIVPAVGFALLGALSFGVFDVLTQLWSNLPGSSFGRVLPWSIMFAAVITAIVIVAMDRRPNRSDVPRERTRFFAGIPRGARLYLALGVGLLALQSLILISSIGYFNDAAGLNVVYSSRGVWSVLVVWLVGHWFSTHERIHAGGLLARRLIAASLIAAAVCLVFF